MSGKIDFKTKAIYKDTKGHIIILKGRIHQKDKKIANIHAPQNIRKVLVLLHGK